MSAAAASGRGHALNPSARIGWTAAIVIVLAVLGGDPRVMLAGIPTALAAGVQAVAERRA